LKQSELIDEGYKVLLYLENDFVQALGFLTPFNTYISRDNINELVIDSTFKTNAILINCGGYGVLLAYLYVDTFTAPADCLQDSQGILFSIENEGILPTFILVDKDAGQITAINEAWSQTANIQLFICYGTSSE